MTSILTNNGAMVALQTLNSINMNLENTQNAISTGKDVATAKDNSAIWAISKVMESDVAGFNAVSDSLALGESTVAVATAGAEQITELLREMKEKVVNATGENVDSGKLEAEVTELKNQITSELFTQMQARLVAHGTNFDIDDIDERHQYVLTPCSLSNKT